MSIGNLRLQLALSKLSAQVELLQRIEVIPPDLYDVATEVALAYRETLVEASANDNVRRILTSLESSLEAEREPTDGEKAALALAKLAIEEIGR